MEYKAYGKTGIQLSKIGFGGMRFDNIKDVETCATLVKTAYDKGINYFDTAPLYFNGRSEKVFGVAFNEMKKTRTEKPFYVSTKTFESNPDKIRRDLEKSLKKLQLDAIDFYHVWCIIRPSEYIKRKKNGVLSTFEKLKDEGLIKNICVSSHMNGEEIGEVLKDYPFVGVLLGYSATNFAYREKALSVASDQGMGVVVMNPLGGGTIPQNPEIFSFLKTQEDESVVKAALRFLLNDPRINITLVGLGNLDHLNEAVDAVKGYKYISNDKIKDMQKMIHESFDSLCTGCSYCDKCKENIPIPKLMDAYNKYVLFKDPGKMIDQIKWNWGILHEGHYIDHCTECGLCEKLCTQKLPIIERLKDIHTEIKKCLLDK